MKTELNVIGMSCSHCVKAIESSLSQISGVKAVAVSLEGKAVFVEHSDSVSAQLLKSEIEDLGYEVMGTQTEKD